MPALHLKSGHNFSLIHDIVSLLLEVFSHRLNGEGWIRATDPKFLMRVRLVGGDEHPAIAIGANLDVRTSLGAGGTASFNEYDAKTLFVVLETVIYPSGDRCNVEVAGPARRVRVKFRH